MAVDSREDYNHLSHASSPKPKHPLVHPESGHSGVPYVLNPKPKLLRAFADRDGSMTGTGLDSEALLMQFNRLIQELLRGAMNRNTLRPWEIELLLDIQACNLRDSNRREILRRYQKAVNRHLDRGATSLLKLSEYLARSSTSNRPA